MIQQTREPRQTPLGANAFLDSLKVVFQSALSAPLAVLSVNQPYFVCPVILILLCDPIVLVEAALFAISLTYRRETAYPVP